MDSSTPQYSRRAFLRHAGETGLAATLAGTISPALAAETSDGPDNPLPSDRKIRVGVVGGGFGANFQWHEHPNCIVHAVSDLRPDRRGKLMKVYGCDRAYESLEKLVLDKQVEAVAIFTGAPDHVRHAVICMDAGKHVISAVPAAISLEQCGKLLDAKRRNHRKYMMAETSYYRGHTIAARDLYREGKFGELFYSEVEYYHPHDDVKQFKKHWYYDGKPTWRYGYPPMLYPTHSTGFLIGVTGERLTEGICYGWGNPAFDIFAKRENPYDNPFSAQMAAFKTDKGHMCRCNVFWESTAHGERAQWFGTRMTYYMPGSGGQPFRIQGKDAPQWKAVPSYWERLPKALRHDSGHGGSHPFITHEFIAALVEDREPAVNIYEALAMTAPGIVAHQSSLKGGEQFNVPSFDPA
jgi:predicted dehydrogenase